MPSDVDLFIREDGQLAVSTYEQTGSIISGGGPTDPQCIVNTENGAQLAIKTVNIGGDTYASGYLRLAQSIPEAEQKHLGKVYMYVGPTNDTYTHGYIYECTGGTEYSGQITFTPNKISISNDDYAAFLKSGERYIEHPENITQGKMLYNEATAIWRWSGYDAQGNYVGRRQIYQSDYEQYGFEFTGPFEDGEELEFATTISAVPGDFAWTRLDVQP